MLTRPSAVLLGFGGTFDGLGPHRALREETGQCMHHVS